MFVKRFHNLRSLSFETDSQAAAFQQQAQALQRASLNAAFSALAGPNISAANAAAANAAVVANVVAANAASSSIMQLPQLPLTPVQPPVQPPQPQSSPQSSNQSSSTPEHVSRKRSVDGTPVGNGDITEQTFLANGGVPQLPLTPNDLVNLINGVNENGEDAEESQEYREFVR